MVFSVQDDRDQMLVELRRHLQFYSATLLDWQQALEEAGREIERLTPEEAAEAADEIAGISQSRDEFDTLKKQVDAGWALYRRLTDAPEMPVPKACAVAIARLAAPARLH